MVKVNVKLDKKVNKIKPMHAVNNGPVRKTGNGTMQNFNEYKAAKIPFARNHDASYFSAFGGEHTVDVHAIFPDFNANPYDPSSYDFTLTDKYLCDIKDAGTEIFYRLGSKIEHWVKKYGVIPPADFNKWAIICEHIIRHYNEGWANGFNLNIVYWEIWNEADGISATGDKPNWTGTPQQYYELYAITATHLKKCFPNLKIGGPAVSSAWSMDWINGFLSYLTKDGNRVPLDFYSWHWYGIKTEKLEESFYHVRKYLDEYGYTETESILNEWNYVEGWTDLWKNSILAIISMRGASFVAASMITGQKSPVDMLMYYDARPCGMNGMFDIYTYSPLKGYYTFLIYSKLCDRENEIASESNDKNIYCLAASNGNPAVMLTHYSPERDVADKDVEITFEGENVDGTWTAYYVDENRTMESIEVIVKDNKAILTLPKECIVYLEK